MHIIVQVHRALVRVLALALFALATSHAAADDRSSAELRVTLPGHVAPALAQAIPLMPDDRAAQKSARESLTLTITLQRTDQAGFEQYLREVYDPASPRFRRYMTQSQLADAFGPSREAYQQVVEYLSQNGFAVAELAANRLTLAVQASRENVERVFGVRIGDYRLGDRTFHANDTDPSLPVSIAAYVSSVAGLSSMAIPRYLAKTTPQDVKDACRDDAIGMIPLVGGIYGGWQWYIHQVQPGDQTPFDQAQDVIGILSLMSVVIRSLFELVTVPMAVGHCAGFYLGYATHHHNNFLLKGVSAKLPRTGRRIDQATAKAVNAQKIGLVEFDTFHPSDVVDWINITQGDPSFATHLTQVHVNGGVGSPGPGESEVLLDIASLMLADPSANTTYVVYDAPGNTTYQQMFNAMINGGVTVISNSWSDCEDQHSLADVEAIDAVLAQAAASGISVLNGSGDNGSSCLDGSANTVGVPASSTHATAVGGTSPTYGPAFTYGSETWWDGSPQSPATGQGGFGLSRFFARPVYQNGFTATATRSVPDLAFVADPRAGLTLCQADAGGCPNGLLYGGTSMAAPLVAGMIAFLNELLGTNVGELNPALYPLASSNAFHSAASMGTDFAHVGLGSPKFERVLALLSGYTVGPADATQSKAGGTLVPYADGTTPAFLRVNLVDANQFAVPGKNVTVTANAGSHAIVSAVNGPSDDDGAVVVTVTDTVAELVTFTVTDTSDGVTLVASPSITFIGPPAAAGGIVATPTTVASDGSSSTTITITLQDAKGQPAAGKRVVLSQGSGHSVITGATPAITNAAGQIQFTATDTVAEAVTYTAVDVNDGNLAIPGSAIVTYTGGSISCVSAPPTAAAGFTLTPFATGFAAQNFFYSNVNWGGCPGASNPAFDVSGNVFVSDFYSGSLSKFGLAGGAVSNANTLATIGQALEQPAFGKDGSLYVARGATGSGFNSGTVLKVDPNTGATLQTLVTGLTCPSPLAVDPLSGDLFFTDTCFGAGADNPSLWRIQNPASASPSLVVYATLPSTPNGPVVFAPNGTMYVVNNYTGAGNIIQVAGTNASSPPAMTTLSGISSDFWMTMGEVLPNGAAKSLLVHNNNALKLVDITTNPFTTTVLANGSLGSGTIGPDGCLYAEASDTILKLAPTAGPCAFASTNPAPALTLSAATSTPSQGTADTLTAKFVNISVPAGTPVTFQINGVNNQLKLANTDATGTATVSVLGGLAGVDFAQAVASVGNNALTSPTLQLTWSSGRHVSVTTVNLSPQAGAPGAQVTLVASLSDISVSPAAPIAGVSVVLGIGNQTCTATTDGQGNAHCGVTAPASGTGPSVTATFAGTAQFIASSASQPFRLVGAAAGVPGAPTIGAATADPGEAVVSFTPPGNNGGSPITAFSVTCTPLGGGAAVTGTGTASPIAVTNLTPGVTYSCMVAAINAAGVGAPSASSNAVVIAAITVTAIPALNEWMLAILMLILSTMGSRAIARRRR
jgi:hypothetical protein